MSEIRPSHHWMSPSRMLGGSGLRQAVLATAYLLSITAALSPLFQVSVPPLVDYPAHLARMAVLSHVGNSAGWTENYVADWRLLPNLAMDLMVPLLTHVMPLELAGKVFIGATMALLVISTAALHRALHGRLSLWPLCSILFVYNAALSWGFLNFLFGLGTSLLCFSAWISTERMRNASRLLIFSVISMMLFILHLFALGVYGLLVVAYESGKLLDERPVTWANVGRRAQSLVQFAPAGLLYVLSVGNGVLPYVSYGALTNKIFAILAPFSFGSTPTVFGLMVAIVACSLFILGFASRVLRLSRRMVLPICAMAGVAAVMPTWLNGSWAADIRLPIALPFVLIASTRINATMRASILVGAVSFAVLLAAQVWAVSLTWRDMNAQFTEFRRASRSIAEGSRLLVVQSPIPDEARRFHGLSTLVVRREVSLYFQMPALAVIDRGVFFTGLFTGWAPLKEAPRNAGMSRNLEMPLTQQELEDRTKAASEPLRRNDLGEPPCCFDWPATFDYVLWIDFGKEPDHTPPQLELVSTGSFFRIYRVVR